MEPSKVPTCSFGADGIHSSLRRYSLSRLKARPGQKLAFQPKAPLPLKTHKMAHEQAIVEIMGTDD
jgi:hypothetical protein